MSEKYLTRENRHETWKLFLSNQREPYILNKEQHDRLLTALTKGSKGYVIFEELQFNLAYFVSMYLVFPKETSINYKEIAHLVAEHKI